MKEKERPTMEELKAMRLDGEVCGMCDFYEWRWMIGVWYTEEGRCMIKGRVGDVRADAPLCNFNKKRSE